MGYSMSVPSNLVQTAFDAYNAPVQSQILQSDLQLKQQEVQAGAMALQNQMGFQQDMTKIWGPGGLAGASAADPNDPSVMPKLMATATDAFARGMPQAGASMLSGLGMMSYRNAEIQKFSAQTQSKMLDSVGSALGGVSDQGSEDAAISAIRAEGIDPAKYGLTGDYALDASKIPALAQAAMSRSQQVLAGYRDQSLQQRDQAQQFREGMAQKQLSLASKRLDIAQSMADLRVHQADTMNTHRDRQDALAQEGLDLKKLQAEDRSYAAAAKVQPAEAQIAQGIFATDDRTANLDPNLQKSLATLASRRAKMAIAQQMQQTGQVEFEPQDYEAALGDQIDKMQREGLFTQEPGGMFHSGGYKFAPKAETPAAKGTTATKPSPYGSPADVATAYKTGKITRAEATKLLHDMGVK